METGEGFGWDWEELKKKISRRPGPYIAWELIRLEAL